MSFVSPALQTLLNDPLGPNAADLSDTQSAQADVGANLAPIARDVVQGSRPSGVDALRAAAQDLTGNAVAPSAAPQQRTDASVAAMSVSDKIATTARAGIAKAASETGGAVGEFLRDPKNDAMLVGGTAAVAGAQFVPGLDVGVDATLGVAGAAMYAAAGPEHKQQITLALGKLKDYAGEVGNAQSQADLDKASRDFADFLKIGGKEAADALGVVAGAAAGGTKIAGLAQKVKELGGLDGVVAAGSRGLGALKDGAGSAASKAEEWLTGALGMKQPQLAPVGGTVLEARSYPTSVRPLNGGARAEGGANGSSALEAERTVLPGGDPATLTGLKPHAIYEFEGGYKYITDQHGRVSEIHATLTSGAGQRSESVQRSAGGLQRLSTDEGGHLIAVRFNGPAHPSNVIAQDVKLNRGDWRKLENGWAKELDQGKKVDVQIKLTYPKDSQRPRNIEVEYQIDGKSAVKSFSNQAR